MIIDELKTELNSKRDAVIEFIKNETPWEIATEPNPVGKIDRLLLEYADAKMAVIDVLIMYYRLKTVNENRIFIDDDLGTGVCLINEDAYLNSWWKNSKLVTYLNYVKHRICHRNFASEMNTKSKSTFDLGKLNILRDWDFVDIVMNRPDLDDINLRIFLLKLCADDGVAHEFLHFIRLCDGLEYTPLMGFDDGLELPMQYYVVCSNIAYILDLYYAGDIEAVRNALDEYCPILLAIQPEFAVVTLRNLREHGVSFTTKHMEQFKSFKMPLLSMIDD